MARTTGEDLRNPNFSGPVGRIWEMDSDPLGTSPASIGMWLIEAPFVNESWSYHTANLITLEDIPGQRPATRRLQGATHEFIMFALSPEFENQYDPEDFNSISRRLLTPPDMIEQLKAETDEAALTIVRSALQKCVDGELLPDSDYRANWAEFFRSTEV